MNGFRKILLAEDDPKDIELTLRALSEHNLANEVALVTDGEQALDYLFRRGKYSQADRPDPAVLLLDLKMPKVDGLQVLEIIKKDESLKTLPVVVLTSSRQESDLVRCYQLGVNSFVVKPVRFDDFMQAIKQLGVYWALVNEPPPQHKM